MARTQTANGKPTGPDTGDLADQIDTLKADLAELTSLISDMGKAESARVKEQLRRKVDDARDAGAEHLSEARAQAEELGSKANDFIYRQPATALGIAAGVGFLVGMMSTRR